MPCGRLRNRPKAAIRTTRDDPDGLLPGTLTGQADDRPQRVRREQRGKPEGFDAALVGVLFADHGEAATVAASLRGVPRCSSHVPRLRVLRTLVNRLGQNDSVKFPPAVGAAEIQDMLGVSRQRVQQLCNAPGFPRPIYELRMGKIWLRSDIEAWMERRKKPR